MRARCDDHDGAFVAVARCAFVVGYFVRSVTDEFVVHCAGNTVEGNSDQQCFRWLLVDAATKCFDAVSTTVIDGFPDAVPGLRVRVSAVRTESLNVRATGCLAVDAIFQQWPGATFK